MTERLWKRKACELLRHARARLRGGTAPSRPPPLLTRLPGGLSRWGTCWRGTSGAVRMLARGKRANLGREKGAACGASPTPTSPSRLAPVAAPAPARPRRWKDGSFFCRRGGAGRWAGTGQGTRTQERKEVSLSLCSPWEENNGGKLKPRLIFFIHRSAQERPHARALFHYTFFTQSLPRTRTSTPCTPHRKTTAGAFSQSRKKKKREGKKKKNAQWHFSFFVLSL